MVQCKKMDSSWGYLNILCVFLCLPVANKWIHEYGQEFLHPCTLNPDEWDGWITGPLQARDLASTIGRHAERRWEPEKWAYRHRTGRACISDWNTWAPGDLRCTALCCTGHGQHKAQRCHGEPVGAIGSQPPQAKCSLAHAGQLLPIERGLCLCTQGWFQLTPQDSVPPASLNMDPLPTLGLLSGLSLQINTTELVQTCYFSSFCTDTCRNRNDRKVL